MGSDDIDEYMSDTELECSPKLPELDETFRCSVVVSNLPQVPEAKVSKLLKVVEKVASKIGTLDEETPSVMPFNKATGKTFGFVFITYKNSADAAKCCEAVNNYQFDKSHKLSVVKYDMVLKLKGVPDQYVEELPKPYKPQPDTSSWLRDESQRDAFCIRCGTETEVHWADGSREPVLDYAGDDKKANGMQWCSNYMEWR